MKANIAQVNEKTNFRLCFFIYNFKVYLGTNIS